MNLTAWNLQEADERRTRASGALFPSDLFLFRPLKPSWDHVVVPENALKNDPKLAQILVSLEYLGIFPPADAPTYFI